MEVTATGTNQQSYTNALSGTQELGQQAFMQLLIQQLKFQDPLQPMEDKEFIAQLAQFSALDQTTQLNQQFSSMAQLFATTQALSLVGRNVDYLDENGTTVSGQVSAVSFSNGAAWLTVNDQEVSPANVSRVW